MKKLLLMLPLAALALRTPTDGATLTIRVTDVLSDEGYLTCALFPSEEGFPMEAPVGLEQRIDAQKGEMTFVFEDLEPGRFAVAVSHDKNGNGRTDTNFLGMPREEWGVSGNVRPGLRAPRFNEASFEIATDMTIAIEIDR